MLAYSYAWRYFGLGNHVPCDVQILSQNFPTKYLTPCNLRNNMSKKKVKRLVPDGLKNNNNVVNDNDETKTIQFVPLTEMLYLNHFSMKAD